MEAAPTCHPPGPLSPDTLLRLVADSAPVYLAYCDTEARYRFVNRPYAARFGLEPHQVVGRRIPEVVGEEAYRTFRHHVASCLAGRPARFELEIPYRDLGSRLMSCSYAPDLDGNGTCRGLVATIVDATSHRRAEEALRESQGLLRSALRALRESETRRELALEAAELGSWHLDLATGELSGSAACKRNFGRAADAPLRPAELLDALHPDDRPAMEDAVRSALEEGRELRAECRAFWPDGSVHWISVRGRVSRDAEGRPASLDGVTLDLTDRKLLERSLRRQTQALQEADRRKDEFLATLAHELRNPLAPLRSVAASLEARGDDPAEVDRSRCVMERQLDLLVRLVDDLLDVSRITRGKIALHRECLDLADVVALAVETSRPLIDARGQALELSLPVRPLYVQGDAVRLAQVVSNLLSNAARYTDAGGRIRLAVCGASDEARIHVCDDGVGIAPDMLLRIFDLFAQAEGALHRDPGGLGLGLTLVRTLVEMHGGHVEAHSDGLGRGSEFVVRLPACAPPADREVAPVADAGGEASPGPGKRVLVADDSVDWAESLSLLLQRWRHDVTLVHDGRAALAAAQRVHPEVVILDLALPELDGLEVARRLRRDPALAGALLIAVTGHGREQDRQASAEAGFDRHLVKPVDPKLLRALLAQPIATR